MSSFFKIQFSDGGAFKRTFALSEQLDALPERLAPVGEREIKSWYRERGGDWFDNPALPTHGSGRKETGWARQLAIAWEVGNVSQEGFQVDFMGDSEHAYGLYNFIHGATITAKGRALTIPMTPEAHGLTAKQFEHQTGKTLFSAKGGLLYDDGDRPRMAYLFKKSVRIRPLLERAGRKAIPDAEDLEPIMNSFAERIIERTIKTQ